MEVNAVEGHPEKILHPSLLFMSLPQSCLVEIIISSLEMEKLRLWTIQ